jgi:hypothetical protein
VDKCDNTNHALILTIFGIAWQLLRRRSTPATKEAILMTEVKGTKELTELVDLPLTLAGIVVAARADGKIDVLDLPLLFGLAQTVGPALEGIGEVKAELADLSEAEAAALIAHIEAKWPALGSEKAKVVAAAGLKSAYALYQLVKAIQAPAA